MAATPVCGLRAWGSLHTSKFRNTHSTAFAEGDCYHPRCKPPLRRQIVLVNKNQATNLQIGILNAPFAAGWPGNPWTNSVKTAAGSPIALTLLQIPLVSDSGWPIKRWASLSLWSLPGDAIGVELSSGSTSTRCVLNLSAVSWRCRPLTESVSWLPWLLPPIVRRSVVISVGWKTTRRLCEPHTSSSEPDSDETAIMKTWHHLG